MIVGADGNAFRYSKNLSNRDNPQVVTYPEDLVRSINVKSYKRVSPTIRFLIVVLFTTLKV